MKISYLQTKPIKNIPNVLVYNIPRTERFNMFTTSKPCKMVGFMDMFRGEYKGKNTLIISYLLMSERRMGYGTSFIKLAKNLSKKTCDGNVMVKAATLQHDPLNPPHVFYRKMGFTTDDTKVLKKIDFAIKKDKQLSWLDLPPTIMYFPPNEPKSKKKNAMFKKIFLNKLSKNSL